MLNVYYYLTRRTINVIDDELRSSPIYSTFLEMRSANCDRHSVDVRTNVTSSSFLHKTPLILADTRDTCLCLRKKKKHRWIVEFRGPRFSNLDHARTRKLTGIAIGCVDIVLALIAKLSINWSLFLYHDRRLWCKKEWENCYRYFINQSYRCYQSRDQSVQ